MSALSRRWLPAAAAAAIAAATCATPAAVSAAAAAPARHGGDPTLTILTGGDRTSIASGSTSNTGGSVGGVAGVVYRVTNASGTVNRTCESNAAGECVFTDIANGSYTVTQVSAPTGNTPSQANYRINTDLGVGTLGSIALTPYSTLPVTVTGNTTVPMGASTSASSSDTIRTTRWAVSRFNPPPPATCARSVALLFDLSASITADDLAAYKSAADGFVRALLGKSTNVTLYTFGTAAPAPSTTTTLGTPNNGTFGPENTLSTTGVNRLITRINGLTVPSGQFTNWDAGIWQIANSATTYNEALVLTDGDPTVYSANGTPDNTGTVRTRFRNIEGGIFSANRLKSRGTRVLAVGIQNNETAGSVANLQSISGPTRNSDFFVIPFDTLDTLLPELALADCASLSITKSANLTTYTHVGQRIEYTYTVKNTSPHDGFTLSAITVHDNRFGTITNCVPDELAPGREAVCDAFHIVTQADLDAGIIENIATATGRTPNGNTVTSRPDDEDVTASRHAAIEVTKTPGRAVFTAPGQTIPYRYRVTNTGNVTLTGVTLIDNRITGITCTPPMPARLAPDASMTCTGTYVTTQADVDAGSVMNRGTATGHPPPGLDTVRDHADARVVSGRRTSIEITKTASPREYTRPGQLIRYTFVVTNNGNMTLHRVTVDDTRLGRITCPHTTLAPGASMTCHATHRTTQADVDAGKIDNTALATGHPDTGPPVTDDDFEDITAGIAPSIEITKTASPTTYSRHGQLITYTYVVSNTGNVSLRDIALTDSRFGPITCPHTRLAPGASMTCATTHSITDVDLDEGSIFNSAAAIGRQPNGGPVESEPAHALVTLVVVPALPEVPVTG